MGPPLKKRIFLVVGLLLFAVIGIYCAVLAVPKHDYFIDRVGSIERDDHDVSSVASIIKESLHLESTTGLTVDMRVLRPEHSANQKLPVLLVIGGHTTGKDAVDLIGKPVGVAVAAIDYPHAGDWSLDSFGRTVASVPKIQRTFLDTAPALALAVRWLVEQPWVDQDRIELVGVSLGVPFAAVAGATESRFSRVWLLHGGADNVSWLAHAGQKHIENATLRRWAAGSVMFLLYGNSLDTAKWIKQIAPRPLIIVAACDDDFVPREAQQPFIEASASDDVELIWTKGQHIVGARRAEELQQLIDIVVSRTTMNTSPPRFECDDR